MKRLSYDNDVSRPARKGADPLFHFSFSIRGSQADSAPPQNGFTLLETLIVITLLSFLGLAVFQALSNGLRVWERGEKFAVEMDAMLFLDRFTEDLHNAVSFSLIESEGGYSHLKFPAVVLVPVDPEQADVREPYVRQVGQIEYRYDALNKVILRTARNYGQALKKTSKGVEKIVMADAEDLALNYYIWDEENAEYVLETKLEEGLPSFVRVDVSFLEDGGSKRTLRRLIDLPVRGR